MDNGGILLTLWPQLTALVAFVFWLARLEAGKNALKSEIENIKRQREEDMRLAKEHRDDIRGTLQDIRHDIKTLLRERT